MVWDVTRGEQGDEYLPEDFQREKAAKREDSKAAAAEQRNAAAAYDPELREAVLDAIPEGQPNSMSQSSLKRALRGSGLGSERVVTVVNSLVSDGLAMFEQSGNSYRYWK
jgi:hypothetical protein